MVWLLIFVGGGLGSLCRYGLASLVQSRAHLTFPIGTLVVNVLGCIIIGIVARHVLNMQTDLLQRAALITGFCGGFTTFSTFSYDVLTLFETGAVRAAWGYLIGSVALSVVAAFAGVFGAHQVGALLRSRGVPS